VGNERLCDHQHVTVILVEGESDRAALEILGARLVVPLPRILAVG
jgi:5S rRNA maturation endonuclease (ribonuclease M5)